MPQQLITRQLLDSLKNELERLATEDLTLEQTKQLAGELHGAVSLLIERPQFPLEKMRDILEELMDNGVGKFGIDIIKLFEGDPFEFYDEEQIPEDWDGEFDDLLEDEDDEFDDDDELEDFEDEEEEEDF